MGLVTNAGGSELNKEIIFNINILDTKEIKQEDVPVVYTNDKDSIEIIFNILDMTDLTDATAELILHMRDGSHFPIEDGVVIEENQISYILKENEGNHAGKSIVQLVLKKGKEYASGLYYFVIENGLENHVPRELYIPEITKGDKGDPGPKGEPGEDGTSFTFEDLTPAQIESLRGAKGEPGKDGTSFTFNDLTPEQIEMLRGPKGEKGDPGQDGQDGQSFTFNDLTPEQIGLLTGPQGPKGETSKDAERVNGYKIMALTEVEYELITKDPDTIYMVGGL